MRPEAPAEGVFIVAEENLAHAVLEPVSICFRTADLSQTFFDGFRCDVRDLLVKRVHFFVTTTRCEQSRGSAAATMTTSAEGA